MNRATRDKFASRTNQTDLTTGTAAWETAPLVFAKIAEDFGPFDVDLCADAMRHLCPRWFGPDGAHPDALSADWMADGAPYGYDNPPYGAFVPKMLLLAKVWARAGFHSTHLLPMRATKAFHAHVLNGASSLWFCDTRLTFFEQGVPRLNVAALEKGKLQADPAMFDSILVRFTPGHIGPPLVGSWQVPPHVTREDLERAEALASRTGEISTRRDLARDEAPA